MVFTIGVNGMYTFWDRPVYGFITWRDVNTVGFIGGGMVFIVVIFVGMNRLTQYRRENNGNNMGGKNNGNSNVKS